MIKLHIIPNHDSNNDYFYHEKYYIFTYTPHNNVGG